MGFSIQNKEKFALPLVIGTFLLLAVSPLGWAQTQYATIKIEPVVGLSAMNLSDNTQTIGNLNGIQISSDVTGTVCGAGGNCYSRMAILFNKTRGPYENTPGKQNLPVMIAYYDGTNWKVDGSFYPVSSTSFYPVPSTIFNAAAVKKDAFSALLDAASQVSYTFRISDSSVGLPYYIDVSAGHTENFGSTKQNILSLKIRDKDSSFVVKADFRNRTIWGEITNAEFRLGEITAAIEPAEIQVGSTDVGASSQNVKVPNNLFLVSPATNGLSDKVVLAISSAILVPTPLPSSGGSTAITETEYTTFGNYRIYAVQGSENSWAKISVRNSAGAEVAQETINKGSSKDFDSLGITVWLDAVKATQDNKIIGVNIRVAKKGAPAPPSTPYPTPGPLTIPSSGGAAMLTGGQTALFGNYKIYAIQGSDNSWAKISVKDSTGTEVGLATINKGQSKDFGSLGITVWLDAVRATQDNVVSGVDIRVAQTTPGIAPSPVATAIPESCPTEAKEIDKAFLLDAAVRLELLKTRFASLGSLSAEISGYWRSTGQTADADRWGRVKAGLGQLIDKIGNINSFVKTIKNNPTTEDFAKLKADIKQLSADLGGILDSIYA